MKYNREFQLSIADIERIEAALRLEKRRLSEKRLKVLASAAPAACRDVDAELAELHTLLGKLHNQKVFYRPEVIRGMPYIGG